MCELQFSAKVKDGGNHKKHKQKIPTLDLSNVSNKHNASAEQKESVLEITQGIKEIEKSILYEEVKPALLIEKAKTKVDKRDVSHPAESYSPELNS